VQSFRQKSNSDNILFDDAVEDIITAFEGVDVEIEVISFSLTSRAKLQGAKVVKGVLMKNKDDMPPTIALGFNQRKTMANTDMYGLKGKFELATDEYDTEAESQRLRVQS
jgi:phi13 family phage major tail protein